MFSGFSIFVQLIRLKMSETEIQPTQNIKNNPKIMKAWAVYDWANSVYSLVITSAIFPIYYTILTTAYNKKEFVPEAGEVQEIPVRNMIKIFGDAYEPEAVLSFSYAISFFLVVLLSPTFNPCTSLPKSNTRPTTSCPGTRGNVANGFEP